MDIKLPNGNTIKGVPEGTSKEEIAAKAIRSGMATAEDFPGYINPDARPADVPTLDASGNVAAVTPDRPGYLSPEERMRLVSERKTLGVDKDTWGPIVNTLDSMGPTGSMTTAPAKAITASARTAANMAKTAIGGAGVGIPALTGLSSALNFNIPGMVGSGLAGYFIGRPSWRLAKKGVSGLKTQMDDVATDLATLKNRVTGKRIPDEVISTPNITNKSFDDIKYVPETPTSVGSSGTPWTTRVEVLEDAMDALRDPKSIPKLILKYTSNSQKALGVDLPPGTSFIERKSGVSIVRLPDGKKAAVYGKQILGKEETSLLAKLPTDAEVINLTNNQVKYMLPDKTAYIFDGTTTRNLGTISKKEAASIAKQVNVNLSGTIDTKYGSAYTELVKHPVPEGYTLMGIHNKVPYYKGPGGDIVATMFGADGPNIIGAELPKALSKKVVPEVLDGFLTKGSRTTKVPSRASLEGLNRSMQTGGGF